MRFIDETRLNAIAGDGGNGMVAFRREKYVPRGGPAGGDGGRGGDVVLVGDRGKSTLLDLSYESQLRASRGQHGMSKGMFGRGGADRVARVPLGTIVFDAEDGSVIGELTEHDQRLVVARGGAGGLGNMRFTSSTQQAPRKATPGAAGERRKLRLELKIMADVGLLGFPNVGKSTLVATVSAARPRVADYPFTTLVPSLGVVAVHGGSRRGGSELVVADIPGLIRGASEGAGLGHRFLRHLERTRALLHLVTLDPDESREPLADYVALRAELERYDPELAKRPELVALSKADLPEVAELYPALQRRFADEHGVELHRLSAASREGLDDVVGALAALVHAHEDEPAPAEPV